MNHLICFLTLGGALLTSAGADPSFLLRNTDPEALFYYWTVEPRPGISGPSALAFLPLAPGGPHAVAPGERVRIDLGGRHDLVGVFVPWRSKPTDLTTLTGGFLLSTEVPTKGTVLVDRSSFTAFNRERLVTAALQAWGLEEPGLILGVPDSWGSVSPQIEWGTGFVPRGQSQDFPGPRAKTLQATDRGGALWVRFTVYGGGGTTSTSVKLTLRRPGTFLEIPLGSTATTVWSWSSDQNPQAVGWCVPGDLEWEAWIPWDRLSPAEHAAWTSARSVWSLIVHDSSGDHLWDLASTSLGEWP